MFSDIEDTSSYAVHKLLSYFLLTGQSVIKSGTWHACVSSSFSAASNISAYVLLSQNMQQSVQRKIPMNIYFDILCQTDCLHSSLCPPIPHHIKSLYRHFPNPPSPLPSHPQDTTSSLSTPRPSRSGFASERPLPIRSSLPRATCNSHRCSRLLQCWPLHPHPRRPPNLPCLPTVRPRIVTCGTPITTTEWWTLPRNIILWPVLPPPPQHTNTISRLSYGSWRGTNWTRIISHCWWTCPARHQPPHPPPAPTVMWRLALKTRVPWPTR